MGLDATVYRHRARLDLGADSSKASLDPETGEVYFEDPAMDRKYSSDYFEAVTFRLGNVAAIWELYEEVADLLNINQKILYSGTHAGDYIRLDELPTLEREIKLLRAKSALSDHLLDLLRKLEILVNAAREHGNPIVF